MKTIFWEPENEINDDEDLELVEDSNLDENEDELFDFDEYEDMEEDFDEEDEDL